ncbi:hypothetical protein B566_EDAN004980 [Ephemera danica]|nr:hypothetical protein B566_EDAN004980 [Ephemera danica]
MARFLLVVLCVAAVAYAQESPKELVDIGKTQWYWTNGQNMAGSNTWEWGAGGATFDKGDGRWAGGEPGNGPWDTEKVSVHVQDRTLTSEPSSVINSVICETAA